MNKWGRLTGIRPAKIVRNMIENGVKDVVNSFMSEYGVSCEKAELTYSVAKREMDILTDIAKNEVGLYIGIPFCRTRCLYCSFVTNATGRDDTHLQRPYVDALKKEIKYSTKIIEQLGCKVSTVYIGGGTPTALSTELLGEVMAEVNNNYPNLREYTVEAGRADTINRENLEVIKHHGATRLCINPQTMNDNVLRVIGRRHSAKQVADAFNMAREIGYDNINMDIIAGLPADSVESFKDTLYKIADMDPEGVTVHTMSIKRGSLLHENLSVHDLAKGEYVEEMVDFAAEYLKNNKHNPYYLYRQKNMLGNLENVGYAKEGFECLYNIMIMEETASIISLGAGGVTKTVNYKDNRIERTFNYKEAYNFIEGIDEILRRKDEIIKKY